MWLRWMTTAAMIVLRILVPFGKVGLTVSVVRWRWPIRLIVFLRNKRTLLSLLGTGLNLKKVVAKIYGYFELRVDDFF